VALGVGEPVLLLEVVCDGVALEVRDVLPVLEGDAPAVSEAVADAESVLEADRVELGVGAGVPLPEPVDDPVGVCVGVTVAVLLPL
jgi:hypothetical protein